MNKSNNPTPTKQANTSDQSHDEQAAITDLNNGDMNDELR